MQCLCSASPYGGRDGHQQAVVLHADHAAAHRHAGAQICVWLMHGMSRSVCKGPQPSKPSCQIQSMPARRSAPGSAGQPSALVPAASTAAGGDTSIHCLTRHAGHALVDHRWLGAQHRQAVHGAETQHARPHPLPRAVLHKKGGAGRGPRVCERAQRSVGEPALAALGGAVWAGRESKCGARAQAGRQGELWTLAAATRA